MTRPNPFKCFQSSPDIIRLAVMLYVRFPLSLRNVEDLLHERGVGALPDEFEPVSTRTATLSINSRRDRATQP